MESLWSDGDADETVAHYGRQNVGRELALRVYSSRLLGRDPRLVLHGGGNTSVKTVMADIIGDEVEVLCVKGSGWGMADIEPAGLPAVRLAPLRRLRKRDALSDEDMVNVQRGNLLDSTAPNPSVETLLHAFLPHKYVDHTHANAVLALTDQPNGADLCAEVFGRRAALVPYIMPGFTLAKAAARVLDENPDCEGLVLLKHGIFSFGDSAKLSYERMVDLVSLAEDRISQAPKSHFPSVELPATIASAARVAPLLRGMIAQPRDRGHGRYRPMVMTLRSDPSILAFVNGAEVARYGRAGPITPDHAIRIKPWPLVVPAPGVDDLARWASGVRRALDSYGDEYAAYFARNNARQITARTQLDSMPRSILVPGVGAFGLGNSAKASKIAADLIEANIKVIADAERLGTYQSISDSDLFDIEYWSLEQAKLGKAKEKPLAGRIVAVTGGAGAIGVATATAFARAGAEVAILDIDAAAVGKAAVKINGLGLTCDVTDSGHVQKAFDDIAAHFGGLDIVVSNAGAAWQGRMGEVSDAQLRESFELNFFAHQTVAQAAVKIMVAQGIGGVLLFNASKQALNPGREFGPYGLPKAATLFLAKQYAVDYGAAGIRSNAVNADRVRSGLVTDDMIATRAHARGISIDDYMTGNLLGREVLADDVARAFVDLAMADKTTGSIVTVDGGNMAAAPR